MKYLKSICYYILNRGIWFERLCILIIIVLLIYVLYLYWSIQYDIRVYYNTFFKTSS